MGATLRSSTNFIAIPAGRVPPLDRFIWRDIALREGFGITMIAEDCEAAPLKPFPSLTRNAPATARALRLASKGAQWKGAGSRTRASY